MCEQQHFVVSSGTERNAAPWTALTIWHTLERFVSFSLWRCRLWDCACTLRSCCTSLPVMMSYIKSRCLREARTPSIKHWQRTQPGPNRGGFFGFTISRAVCSPGSDVKHYTLWRISGTDRGATYPLLDAGFSRPSVRHTWTESDQQAHSSRRSLGPSSHPSPPLPSPSPMHAAQPLPFFCSPASASLLSW